MWLGLVRLFFVFVSKYKLINTRLILFETKNINSHAVNINASPYKTLISRRPSDLTGIERVATVVFRCLRRCCRANKVELSTFCSSCVCACVFVRLCRDALRVTTLRQRCQQRLRRNGRHDDVQDCFGDGASRRQGLWR